MAARSQVALCRAKCYGCLRERDPRNNRSFLAHRISFPDCIASLDAALAALVPTLTGEQISRLRIVMLANTEIVMKKMEKRGPAVPYVP